VSILHRLRQFGPIDDAKILDLREHEGWYHFHISGSRCGFADALNAVKEAFTYGEERLYDSDTKEWSVPATDESREKLEMIFSNGASAMTALHSQLRMF
jgi:hypothetical protein